MNWKTESMTPLDKNKVWEEHCRKEALQYKPSTQFAVYPSSVPDLAPKPNTRGKRFLDKDALFLESIEKRQREKKDREEALARGEKPPTYEMDPMEIDAEFTKSLRDTGKVPAERYTRPRAGNQDYGWFHEPLMEHTELNFKPRSTCDVTKFAQELVKTLPPKNN